MCRRVGKFRFFLMLYCGNGKFSSIDNYMSAEFFLHCVDLCTLECNKKGGNEYCHDTINAAKIQFPILLFQMKAHRNTPQ